MKKPKNKPKFKVGDKLRCKPGYNKDDGGSGYKSNRIFTVKSIDDYNDDSTVYWPLSGHGHGIHQIAVEFAESKILIDYDIY